MFDRIYNQLQIHKGERRQLAYLLIIFVLMGAGMALGRGTADALFFKRYGIEYLPIMFILIGIMLSVLSVVYAAFVDALPSERFFKIIFIVMLVLLLGNWLMISLNISEMAYPLYFLLYEIASELLLVHGALYLGQNMLQTQSKRLMPIVLAGSQVGVIIGGLFLASMSKTLGLQNMMLVWAGIMMLSFGIVTFWHTKKGASPYYRAGRKERSRLQKSINQVMQGLKFIKSSELLKMSSLALFFMVIATYVLIYTMNRIYTSTFETEEALGSFFGILISATSVIALFMQIFISNRAMRSFGVKRINLVYPVTSVMVYIGLMFSFTLPLALLGSLNRNAIMPVFHRPVRNVFMDALPMQMQGRERAISNVIVLPLALVVAGIFLWVVQRADNPSLFLVPGMIAALVYFYFNRRMNSAYAKEIVKNLKQRLFVPEHQILGVLDGADKSLLSDIEKGVLQSVDEISIAYSSALSKVKPERAAHLLPKRMKQASVPTKDQMIRMLKPLKSRSLRDELRQEIGKGDAHLDATLYKALFEAGDEAARKKVKTLLRKEIPRLRAAGIFGALIYPVPELVEQAIAEWMNLLNDARPGYYMPGMELAMQGMEFYYLDEPVFGAIQQVLVQMLEQPNPRFQLVALKMIVKWPTDNLIVAKSSVIKLAEQQDWKVRREVVRATQILSIDEREALIHRFIEDHHPDVREAAVKSIFMTCLDPQQWLLDQVTKKSIGSPRAKQTMIECLIEFGISADLLKTVSIRMAELAVQTHAAIKLLTQESHDAMPSLKLLTHALEERTHELVDLSLLSLQTSPYDSDIEVIRAGLASGDKRHISNSCELLSMINDGRLTPLLLSIYDGGNNRQLVFSSIEFNSIDDVIAWISNGTDPWLNECVSNYTSTQSSECYV